ncbi:RING finger protein 112-like [Alligator sinensis]|uniref:RING finger protein 112-like n=1 Tax=Alligator sinensis TaxID=38654 RepID=A0A3Q0FWR8_ALLSI|nr:RING finger protein 112-like [Alligator sinensis]
MPVVRLCEDMKEHPKTSKHKCPVQIISLDDQGGLALANEALSQCLEQGDVGDAPVCLISIIGEQRRGKSFLMTCLLRQLQNQEDKDASWMGSDDEPLEGFEWRSGPETVTKGVWMWGEPLWVQVPQGKVAVFLVDTEGSMDLQRQLETSIKLSVFSILLSSYQIFNILSEFKLVDQDYLEMFITVAEEVGKNFNLYPVQHLDLLIRDWQHTSTYGVEGGQEHLKRVIKDLESLPGNDLVLKVLKAAETQCYLMPHPGTRFTRSNRLGDFEKDFQDCLKDYVTTLVALPAKHVRKDSNGHALTGKQLAMKIRDFFQFLEENHYDFSSPVKMAETLANMREQVNRKIVDIIKGEYSEFVLHQDRDTQTETHCLNISPTEMQKKLEEKCQELLERCRRELLGDEQQKEAMVQDVGQELRQMLEGFMSTYNWRFKEMENAANRTIKDKFKQQYKGYITDQGRENKARLQCCRVQPRKMRQCLEKKGQELLQQCEEELRGAGDRKQAVLRDLEQELTEQMDDFLSNLE